jgi:hypothetical protein
MDKVKLIKGEAVKHVSKDHPHMPELIDNGWKIEKEAAPKKSKAVTKAKAKKSLKKPISRK